MVAEDLRARITSYIKHQAGKGPAAVAALVADSQGRLQELLASVEEPLTTRRPAPEEWCVRELLRHVIDAEQGVATLVRRLSGGTPPRPDERRSAGMLNDDGGQPYAAMLEELRAASARLQEAIGALPAEPDASLTAPHPFFGELNCIEWAVFQKVHDEDHIQHARKILAAIGGS
jgi:hypothetical protein